MPRKDSKAPLQADQNGAQKRQKAARHLFGLRTKLLLAFLLVSLVPLCILGYLHSRGTKQALTSDAYRVLSAAAAHTAARLDSFVSNNLDVIEAEAQIPALASFIANGAKQGDKRGQTTAIHDLLFSLSRKDPVYISAITLMDISGRVVADTRRGAAGLDLSSRIYFRQALETGLPYASPVLFSQNDGKAYMHFSCLVNDDRGRPAGVLRTRYSAQLLQEMVVFDNDLAGAGSFPVVVDDQNVLLAYGHVSHLAASEYLFKSLVPVPTAQIDRLQAANRLPQGPAAAVTVDLGSLKKGISRVGLADPFFTTVLPTHDDQVLAGAVTVMRTQPFRVAFLQPQHIFLTPVRKQLYTTLWLVAGFTVLVAATGFGMASILARPIIRLTTTVKRVGEGDLGARQEVKGSAEVATLASSFNEMAERLQHTLQHLEHMVQERTKDLAAKAEELEEANRKLLELDELKSAFLSTVSHELRTPLTSVLGFTRLIEKDFDNAFRPLAGADDKLGKRAERIMENLEIIREEGARLSRMINDFLDLAKIEAGGVQWQETDVDLTKMLPRAAGALSSLFVTNPDVELVVDVPDQLPTIRIDGDRLEQVVINLLNNAAKFTSRGRVTLGARAEADDRVHIFVADTGEGIPAAEMEKLFDKFHQVSKDDRSLAKPQGTGLGLAICREIVARYEGRIRVESEVGKGSVFHVELPLAASWVQAAT